MVIAETKRFSNSPLHLQKKNVNQSFVKTYPILIIYYFAFKYNYVPRFVTPYLDSQ